MKQERSSQEFVSRIVRCSCEHQFQDSTYGKRLRVHSVTKQNKIKAERRLRCSVCLREKEYM